MKTFRNMIVESQHNDIYLITIGLFTIRSTSCQKRSIFSHIATLAQVAKKSRKATKNEQNMKIETYTLFEATIEGQLVKIKIQQLEKTIEEAVGYNILEV